LERALRGGKSSSSHEESTHTRTHHPHPNGEYFGNSHSFLPHLEVSRGSKGSLGSKGSKGSKGRAGVLVEERMKQYRALESKHSRELERIVGASPKEVRRLQKMQSLERLHAMEALAKASRLD
jgi:hypothetical protein